MKRFRYTPCRLLCVCLVMLAVQLAVGGCALRTVMGSADDGAGRTPAENGTVDFSTVTVCVDPGHGFDDIGTSSAFLGETTENQITLSVALYLREALEELGFSVILTHDGASFPLTAEDDGNQVFSPQERVAYADTLDIDFYISIHCDSYEADASVHGARVYYSKGTKYTKKSARIAEQLSNAVQQAFPNDKKCTVRDMANSSAYYVIRENSVPSSLVEMGFVTNQADAEKMLDESWKKSFAVALADGIAAFFAE